MRLPGPRLAAAPKAPENTVGPPPPAPPAMNGVEGREGEWAMLLQVGDLGTGMGLMHSGNGSCIPPGAPLATGSAVSPVQEAGVRGEVDRGWLRRELVRSRR
jgi:hypothetical protein